MLKDNEVLAQRAALYRTVPGVGPLTAATLVAHLPELGHWDSKALTSLVGLAMVSRKRQEEGPPGHPGRPRAGAAHSLHVRLGRDPPR